MQNNNIMNNNQESSLDLLEKMLHQEQQQMSTSSEETGIAVNFSSTTTGTSSSTSTSANANANSNANISSSSSATANSNNNSTPIPLLALNTSQAMLNPPTLPSADNSMGGALALNSSSMEQQQQLHHHHQQQQQQISSASASSNSLSGNGPQPPIILSNLMLPSEPQVMRTNKRMGVPNSHRKAQSVSYMNVGGGNNNNNSGNGNGGNMQLQQQFQHQQLLQLNTGNNNPYNLQNHHKRTASFNAPSPVSVNGHQHHLSMTMDSTSPANNLMMEQQQQGYLQQQQQSPMDDGSNNGGMFYQQQPPMDPALVAVSMFSSPAPMPAVPHRMMSPALLQMNHSSSGSSSHHRRFHSVGGAGLQISSAHSSASPSPSPSVISSAGSSYQFEHHASPVGGMSSNNNGYQPSNLSYMPYSGPASAGIMNSHSGGYPSLQQQQQSMHQSHHSHQPQSSMHQRNMSSATNNSSTTANGAGGPGMFDDFTVMKLENEAQQQQLLQQQLQQQQGQMRPMRRLHPLMNDQAMMHGHQQNNSLDYTQQQQLQQQHQQLNQHQHSHSHVSDMHSPVGNPSAGFYDYNNGSSLISPYGSYDSNSNKMANSYGNYESKGTLMSYNFDPKQQSQQGARGGQIAQGQQQQKFNDSFQDQAIYNTGARQGLNVNANANSGGAEEGFFEDENDMEHFGPTEEDYNQAITQCNWGTCILEMHTQDALVAHILQDHVGTGKASYVCEWSGCTRLCKPFSKRHKIQNHVRIHTGERPFACPVAECGKKFSRQDGLNTHIKTHSSIKPYVCSYPPCGKAYFHSRSLRKHERTHMEAPITSYGVMEGSIVPIANFGTLAPGGSPVDSQLQQQQPMMDNSYLYNQYGNSSSFEAGLQQQIPQNAGDGYLMELASASNNRVDGNQGPMSAHSAYENPMSSSYEYQQQNWQE